MIRQEKTVINGIELFAQASGEANETIVLFHGGGMSSEYWMPQLQDGKLTGKYSRLAIDLPGHGSSTWMNENDEMYRPDKMALLVDAVLKAYKVSNYILAGISLGTNIIGEIK